MYFTNVLVTLGLVAAASACSPGTWGCGNNPVPGGTDGALYVCDSSSNWEFSAQCGGSTCCHLYSGGAAGCTC